MDYSVTIERMAYGPEGVGRLPDGKAVFVERAAPGDKVRVQVTEDKKSFARAKLLEVEEPSPLRVEERSSIDALCGTAPWQHIAYESQLELKRGNIVAALVRTAKMPDELAQAKVRPAVGSRHPWHYRNKLELGCGADDRGRFTVGFHKDRSDRLIPVDATALGHKAIQKSPKALRGAIRYALGSRESQIYRIGVRHSMATGNLEVALWTPPGAFPRSTFAKTLKDALKATGVIRVLAHPGKARKIKGVEVLEGYGRWRERVGGFEFATQAPSFFQVNTEQCEQLMKLVLEGLGDVDGKYVADLFAGGGTFSIPLAAAGADVVAVEAAASSVRDLRANAERNGVDVDVWGGDAGRELAELGDLDGLVVDPPRAGLGPQVVESIAEAHPDILVYVSCDPSTWARDVALLRQQGYGLTHATPVDLFPQTYHIETVSFFKPGEM